MSNFSPLVGVFPRVEIAGWSGVDGEELERAVPVTLEQALYTQWDYDAHLITYHAVDKGTGEPYPDEQGKPILYALKKCSINRIESGGGSVIVPVVLVEYDCPNHIPWLPGKYEEFIEKIGEIASSGYPLIATPTAFYRTRAGARWVYVLSRPIGPEMAEGLIAGLIRDFSNVGIPIDTACQNWNRLWRLPQVIRDGNPTWADPSFDLNYYPDNLLDPDSIELGRVRERSEFAAVEPETLDMPTPEECHALLWNPPKGKGQETMTAWHSAAKTTLKNRDCYGVAFLHEPLGSQGNRMNKVQSYIGEACSMLCMVEGTTSQHVMALFAPALLQLEPDRGTPDWYAEGWLAVTRYWHRERQKAQAKKEKLALQQLNADDKLAAITESMKSWCNHPALYHEDPEVAREWASHHLIATCGQTHFIMRPDGTYDRLPLAPAQVASRVREMGMSDLIRFEVPTEKGKKEVSLANVLRKHSTNVNSIQGSVDIPRDHIENIETPSAVFRFKLFERRDDLEPRYSPVVERWLRHWFELDEDFERLVDWIGHALAIEDGPICALSIKGKPGCGKKLLVQGLAECFKNERVATEKDFGEFNAGLMYSPFLVVNEGLPRQGFGRQDIADIFRHYVSGDPIMMNQKYREPMLIRNPVRVICTANNEDILEMLTGHRDLSPEDREAILIRILHMEVSPMAAAYLRDLGGLAYTGASGNRWIRSDGGAPSDYVVARHFLHLYNTRKPVKAGSRLLVEGHITTELLQRIATQGGSSPAVIRAIVHMTQTAPVRKGFKLVKDAVHVTIQAILDMHEQLQKIGGKPLTNRQVSNVLKSISFVSEHREFDGLSAQYYRIDEAALLAHAIRQGLPCDVLMKRQKLIPTVR